LNDYVVGGQDYKASDIIGRQVAAFDYVKDMASPDDKKKLYFIAKDANKKVIVEEVKG
jgi:hypothetical protein